MLPLESPGAFDVGWGRAVKNIIKEIKKRGIEIHGGKNYDVSGFSTYQLFPP